MDLDRFLEVVATLFGGIGSLYLLRSVVSMSPVLMAKFARGYLDFSMVQIESLVSQKADGIVGIVLVTVALAVAFVNSAFVPSGIRAFSSRSTALTLAVSLAAVTYVILWSIGGAVQKHERRAVGRVITADCLDSLLQKNRVTRDDLESLEAYSRPLIGTWRGEGESARQFVARVAHEVGRDVPNGVDYSAVDGPPVQ